LADDGRVAMTRSRPSRLDRRVAIIKALAHPSRACKNAANPRSRLMAELVQDAIWKCK